MTLALAPHLARGLGSVLAFVVGDVLRVRRGHVERAMGRAGLPEPERTAREMYRSLGWGLVELLALAFGGRAPRVHGAEGALAGLARRGAVVATAHTGSWDVVACALARVACLTVVTKRLSVRFLDLIWQRVRRAHGVDLVEVGGARSAIARALGRRELVAMLVDQAPERRRGAVRMAFLGEAAWVDLAPALCAMRARVPLVAAFPVRLADGTHAIEVARVLEPPARPSRIWAEGAMREVTLLLEDFVRRHPEQWLWMHRRWKDGHAPLDRRSPLAAARPSGLSGA